jgi:hypothetical protein
VPSNIKSCSISSPVTHIYTKYNEVKQINAHFAKNWMISSTTYLNVIVSSFSGKDLALGGEILQATTFC